VDAAYAATLPPEQLLLYRSNLLGADHRITISAAAILRPIIRSRSADRRQRHRVVGQGSGGDLGTMQLDGFATLYLDKLLALQDLYRGREHEDDLVALYPHCAFNLILAPPASTLRFTD